MRIALLTPGGVDRSGVDRVIPCLLWLIERLARRHDVHVFAFSQEAAPDSWELLGARVHNIGTLPGWRRRFFATFAAEHRTARFDVLQAFFGSHGTYAAAVGRRYSVPVTIYAAGGELVGLRDIGYGMRCGMRGRLALRLAVAGARRITVGTRYMQRLADDLGIPTELVPLGVALDRWPPAAPRARDVTRPARLLHIADIRPVKDQQMLLAAVGMLRRAGVPFQLDVAGYDTMNGAMQRVARDEGVDDVTHWHGVLHRDALRALAERADLLLHTSRHDASPVAVLEAAVAGVPAVGTAVGWVDDWAPAAARAVPVGDAAALAREIQALLADEPLRLALAREAQQRAVAMDADYTVGALERVYGELVRQAR